MTDDPSKMSCAEFQAQLSEMIGSGEDVSAHPHVQDCELCRALLADLETIAEAARQLVPERGAPGRSLGADRVSHPAGRKMTAATVKCPKRRRGTPAPFRSGGRVLTFRHFPPIDPHERLCASRSAGGNLR